MKRPSLLISSISSGPVDLPSHIGLEQLGGFVHAIFRQDIQFPKSFLPDQFLSPVTDNLFALAVAVKGSCLLDRSLTHRHTQ